MATEVPPLIGLGGTGIDLIYVRKCVSRVKEVG